MGPPGAQMRGAGRRDAAAGLTSGVARKSIRTEKLLCGGLMWMNAIRIMAVLFAVTFLCEEARPEDDPSYAVVIRDLNLTELTPFVALRHFHDAWQEAAGPASVPPFILVGETNGTSQAGTFKASEIEAREVFRVLEKAIPLRHTIYTNGIVFFPPPCYDAEIVFRELSIGERAANALGFPFAPGSNAPHTVEACLRACGLNYPSAGCGAVYEQARGVLRVWHVPNEVAKAGFLVTQLDKGESARDVSIDPTVHFAPVYYVYDGRVWTEHRANKEKILWGASSSGDAHTSTWHRSISK